MSVKETSSHFNNVEGIAYKYTIDDYKGIVACYVKPMNPYCDEEYPIRDDYFLEHYFEKRIKNRSSMYYDSLNFEETENEAKGIAKCHDNDKFEEEIGKKIAYYRAYNKFMTCRKNRMAAFIKELADMQKDAKDLYNMLRCKLARNEVRLEEFTK